MFMFHFRQMSTDDINSLMLNRKLLFDPRYAGKRELVSALTHHHGIVSRTAGLSTAILIIVWPPLRLALCPTHFVAHFGSSPGKLHRKWPTKRPPCAFCCRNEKCRLVNRHLLPYRLPAPVRILDTPTYFRFQVIYAGIA